jgi:hypothetical protein
MMFMGRLVKEPSDTLIYGRAIGMHHEPGRDDATERDLKKRWWKKRWPHYVRVHHAEFISGNLSNGISLNELMDALGPDSFASTKRNAARREGNTGPRRAYRQKPSVELSAQGIAWLNGRLEGAFARHGRIPLSKLDKLDWPKLTSPFE